MLLFEIFRWLGLLASFLVPCHGSLQPGFSKLQREQRLDKRVIQSFVQLSFLDCVTECLVTPRCKSVNYFKGANFCETNYENKTTASTTYKVSAGWVYTEKEHWPKDLAGACANSNCQINQTCKHKIYSKDTSCLCVLSDCGIPNRTGISLSTIQRGDAIGIHRRIHASCSVGYLQFGSGRLVCLSNGEWKYDILCEKEAGWVQFENHIYRLLSTKNNWKSAKEYCESIDAYLVEIESSEENTWIYNKMVYKHFLPSNDTCQAEHWKCSVWIGGAWSAESEFIWSKSGNRITFTQWSHGEPSDGNEDCMEMFAATGKWNDKKCDYNTSFICEKHIN